MLCFFLLTLTLSIVISLYIYELFSALSQAFVDKLKCHYLTRNSFFPLLLITLLSSMKTIVPIAVNTSLRTRSYTVTGKKQVRKNILENQILLQTRVIGEEQKKFCVNREE